MRNCGEPRYIVHKFGEVSDNPYHVANQLDEPARRREYGRTMRLGDGSEGDYICTACFHVHDTYPCIAAGDEVVSRCEECGSLECIERFRPADGEVE